MTPTISETLRYANLQMAAEALYRFDANETPLQAPAEKRNDIPLTVENLTTGNRHASKFPQLEAEKFATRWTVVEHLSNTTTGFSGTLFKEKGTDKLVLSFRSTEFVDDAARDNQATNKMEIAEGGWAMGQIADMDDWYASLKRSGKIPAGSSLTVTGYSLGGHLATAFNLLHPGEAGSTYTFNGAGVGKLDTGQSLRAIVDRFNLQRKNTNGLQIVFTDSNMKSFYDGVRSRLNSGSRPTDADFVLLESTSTASPSEKLLLRQALANLSEVYDEVIRLATLTSGSTTPGEPTFPAPIPVFHIEATRLDYQLAVAIAQRDTQAYSKASEAWNIATDARNTVSPPEPNVFDIYGATYPSVVSSSQLHYGAPTPVFVEDQPLYRGSVIKEVIRASLDAYGLKFLVDRYAHNDFGDTHSLVLLVDSLNLQNALATLDPLVKTDTLNAILQAASNARSNSAAGDQGKAEGDVLENVLNSLSRMILGSAAPALPARLDGNTWADITDRNAFYTNLNALTGGKRFTDLIGKVTVTLPGADLGNAARTDFASLLTLLTLSPVALRATVGNATAVAETLKAEWDSEYSDWKADGDLTPEERADGQGNYTDRYLVDRAAFLTRIVTANLANTGTGKDLHVDVLSTDTLYFEDRASGMTLQEVNSLTATSDGPRYLFGGDGNDSSFGGDEADHLYGGAGMDRIDGGKGDDHLEGNAGSDILSGGEGPDTLLGGSGMDHLEGGKGNDLLDGGAGDDTYVLDVGGGFDTIRDSDGIDHIRIGDQTLSLADWVADGFWQKDGISYRFKADDSGRGDLVITSPAGITTVKDYRKGQLGLTLADTSTTDAVRPTTRDILGDFQPLDHDPVTPGVQSLRDDLGNLIGDPGQPDPAYADTLKDSAGNDHIQSGGGRDLIDARRGGADWIEAGAGDDWVDGGAGADRIQGGDGRDIIEASDDADTIEGGNGYDLITGGSGDDHLYARDKIELRAAFADNDVQMASGAPGEPGDLLDGGEGDDALVGDAGNDFLAGGAGDDLMIGGGGDDNLWGDAVV
ncbi:MAG: hypothetical protein JNK06_03535, partial [Candidatus Accumulibacter phosphatis]|nr:hypothetical protein [Candidatus Accumulibacter phosphatis]